MNGRRNISIIFGSQKTLINCLSVSQILDTNVSVLTGQEKIIKKN